MEVLDNWNRGYRWGLLAALITMVGVAIEVSQENAGPLVSLYLLAALIGFGLPRSDYRRLIAFIVVAMVVPLLLRTNPSDDHAINATLQRLIALVCLGLLVLIADQQSKSAESNGARAAGPARDDGSSLVSKFLGVVETPSLLVLDPLANDCDIDFEDVPVRIGPDEVISSVTFSKAPPTCNMTKIRDASLDIESEELCDLSFDDHHTSHEDSLGIIERLRATGKFDEESLELVEKEVRSAISHGIGIDAKALLEPGVQIGRFMVDEPLGRGGEGHVYRGHDFSGEPAAIKILHNMRVSDRFRREMHLVRQLAHPNIVTAYEVGDYRGLPFITMELLRGPDLHVLVRENGALPWRASLKYVLQAAHALAHAHHRDLIHRDVKPGNLILNGDDVVKLVDLGLAAMGAKEKRDESVVQYRTKDGHLAGTLPYMAPEQARSLADATIQSDIYGLGATWFYLLTGEERLIGKSFAEQYENLLLWRRFNQLPEGLMPPSLLRIYRRMVAYDRNDRYADTSQLVVDLERAMKKAGESVATVDAINVLVVEDSRTDMVLTIEVLRRSNSALSIHEARSLGDGIGVCQEMPIDLVLLDLSLPDSAGVDTVKRFRSAVPDTPLVVLTGMSRDEIGSQCLEAGATTFISKSGLTPHRMERTIFVTLSRYESTRNPPDDEPKS